METAPLVPPRVRRGANRCDDRRRDADQCLDVASNPCPATPSRYPLPSFTYLGQLERLRVEMIAEGGEAS